MNFNLKALLQNVDAFLQKTSAVDSIQEPSVVLGLDDFIGERAFAQNLLRNAMTVFTRKHVRVEGPRGLRLKDNDPVYYWREFFCQLNLKFSKMLEAYLNFKPVIN